MEYNVIKLVNNLDRDRFILSIVALETVDGIAKEQVAKDVEIFKLSKGYGFQAKLIWQLAQLFRQQQIDAIHSHNWTTFLYTVLAARLASVRLILHGEHGRDTEQYEHDWKKLRVRQYLASCCDQLTVVSSDIARILRDIWGVPEWKISVIPNGVLLDKFKPVRDRGAAKRALGIVEHAPAIGTVIGSIRPVKDLPTLFKAFALVRKRVPEAQLLIVGHAPTLQQFEGLVKQLAIADAVHFLGKRSDIPEIMSALDVYVNSSIYEGMSNTILEAMACGVPVVATAVGGTPAIVSDGVNGSLVPPKAPEPMSEAILRLLQDENKRQAMTRAGRQQIERHHCFQETVRRYETLYLDWAHQKLRSSRVRRPAQELKAFWGSTCDNFGVLKWRGKIGRRSINIINYHRVLHAQELRQYLFTPMALPVSVFERQMDFFRRRCHVLSLAECLHILQNDLPIPERAVVLTFDDGYKELYTVVRPILEKYQLPVTIFLPTDLIGKNTPLWFDAVARRLQMADLRMLAFRDEVPKEIITIIRRLRNLPSDQCNRSARVAVSKIAELRHDLRMAVVDALMTLEIDSNGSLDITLLNWEMVKEMQATGLFTFGSHTATHSRLDLLPEQELDKEIAASGKLLEEKLNHPAEFFSYPWGCYNDFVVGKVKHSGYRCALALTDAPNFAKADLYKLKRIDSTFLTLEASFHEGMMAAELAGLNTLWRSFTRLSNPTG
jgi:sugar transferase (PEP-CTERM/EpsH1 system associated)